MSDMRYFRPMTEKPIRPTSQFSLRFAQALREALSSAGITQMQIREQMENTRTQSFISERLRGVRPVDTDILDAVAELMRVSPRELTRRILRDMGDEGGATVTPLRPTVDRAPSIPDDVAAYDEHYPSGYDVQQSAIDVAGEEPDPPHADD